MTSLTDLRRVAEEAFPMNIDSAATIMDREIDCPICGDGAVETRLFENFDNNPVSVEVYGIGDALTKTEAFLRLVNPATVLSLLDRIEKAEAENAALRADITITRHNLHEHMDAVPDLQLKLARAHALLREAVDWVDVKPATKQAADFKRRIRAELAAGETK